MKIAIFENEKTMVEGAFETMNLVYYDNVIEYKFFLNSQDGLPFENLKEYDIILVDIQLTAKSELDGFNLIKTLIPIVGHNKLGIITGFSKNEEILKELKLPSIPIINKPIDYDSLYKFLTKNFPSSNYISN